MQLTCSACNGARGKQELPSYVWHSAVWCAGQALMHECLCMTTAVQFDTYTPVACGYPRLAHKHHGTQSCHASVAPANVTQAGCAPSWPRNHAPCSAVLGYTCGPRPDVRNMLEAGVSDPYNQNSHLRHRTQSCARPRVVVCLMALLAYTTLVAPCRLSLLSSVLKYI